MTTDKLVTAVVVGLLTWATTYFSAAAPAKERWDHWKGLNAEKRETIRDLRAELALREAECAELAP